jgi:hypothetical protein
MFYEYTIDDFLHPNPMTSLSVIYISKYMLTHMEFTHLGITHTKDKQRSTKHTYKTKDRVTRTPLNNGGKLLCSGRVSTSYRTSQEYEGVDLRR